MADDRRDLLLAILAMDSYNQGYGEGLTHGSRQIGSAVKFTPENFDETPWEASGFYAAAYELPGETVMSFCGTDRAIDVLTGWPVGAGASFYGA